ncbi:MAG: hypothetical protein M3159_03710 [Actinomycetota bacterium]|nr:hypothetical protein [Actinomycetota bacterium]
MPEDPNFGDIDDAQLEAAMAALLQTYSSSSPPPDVTPEAEPEPISDLDVSPWAPAATAAAADLALDDAGFGGPLHAALGDLGDLNSDTLASPPPPHEQSSPPSSLPPPNFPRPWKNRRRELVPALVVGLLVLLGLAAVIATLTNADGGGTNVSLSTPTSLVPTTTTIGTIPPPPPPLPVDLGAPPPAPSASVGSGFAPRRFQAPKKSVAPKPSASPAPAPSGSGPVSAPSPPADTPSSTPTPTTSPPTTGTTSPPTTTPSTTTPPTTQPRPDHCTGLTGSDLDRCLAATGGR